MGSSGSEQPPLSRNAWCPAWRASGGARASQPHAQQQPQDPSLHQQYFSRQPANPLVRLPADRIPEYAVGGSGGWRTTPRSVSRTQPPGRCQCGIQGARQAGGRSLAGEEGTQVLQPKFFIARGVSSMPEELACSYLRLVLHREGGRASLNPPRKTKRTLPPFAVQAFFLSLSLGEGTASDVGRIPLSRVCSGADGGARIPYEGRLPSMQEKGGYRSDGVGAGGQWELEITFDVTSTRLRSIRGRP